MFHASPLSSILLFFFPLDVQRNHLEGPHSQAYGILMNLE
jgi:hypothetical protein